MYGYGRLNTAIAVATLFGTSVAAQSENNQGVPTVAVIIIENYPAFNPPPTTPSGRPTLEVRALVLRLPPWSGEHAAIILNPAHANAETLNAAMRALRKSIRSSGTKNILVTARSVASAPGFPVNAGRLNAKLQELQRQPLVDIVKVGRKGRQITINNFVEYLETDR
jgi:hypothetical protein